MSEFFNVETAVNYEQKSLCVLLLDVSGSMQGQKLNSLQKGIEAFHEEIAGDPTTQNRLEVAIIAYGSNIKILQQPALVDNFEMPQLETMGSTSMGKAIDEAIELLKSKVNTATRSAYPNKTLKNLRSQKLSPSFQFRLMSGN